MDDVMFTEWINELGAEEIPDSNGRVKRARSANQVITIGRRALHFLVWIQ